MGLLEIITNWLITQPYYFMLISLFLVYFFVTFVYAFILFLLVNVVFDDKFKTVLINGNSKAMLFSIVFIAVGLQSIASIAGFLSPLVDRLAYFYYFIYFSVLLIIVIQKSEVGREFYKSLMSFIIVTTLIAPTDILLKISETNIYILGLSLVVTCGLMLKWHKHLKNLSDFIVYNIFLGSLFSFLFKRKSKKGAVRLITIIGIIVLLLIVYFIITYILKRPIF